MKLRFFDFEVTPNWWECTFGDLPEDYNTLNESIKDTFIVITSDDENYRDKLLAMMREPDICVVGYNIKGYDLAIANGVYQGFTPQQIKIINDIIINPGCAYLTKEHIRLQTFAKRKLPGIVYQDLMDDGDGSLKEKEAILGLDIQESTVDFNKENLTEFDKADMTYYNKHDVYAAMIYFVECVDAYTRTKLTLGKLYNIDEKTCRASTNAKLVAAALKARRRSFADIDEINIEVPAKIRSYCKENLPYDVLHHLQTSQEQLHVKLFGNEVDFGNGGIHSVYAKNLYIESDDEFVLMNVDAGSYYPSIMIQFGLLSRTLEKPELFAEIFDKRMAIKHKEHPTPKDKEDQLGYKLVLNTTFGASGNKYLDLYDPYMCTSVCRVGQIFLAALACKLKNRVYGLEIIQTNTDGILCYCRRKDIPLVKSLMDEWTAISGINMEDDYVDKIWQRDVNNYLLVKADGSIKKKGAWLSETAKYPGSVKVKPLTGFASAKAVTKYLLGGKDIIQSIVENKDLNDFIISCKKGPSYSSVVQRLDNGQEITLFKCNRIIASKNEKYGRLYKVKKYKDRLSYTQMPNTPEHCRLMNNDLSTYSFDELKSELDYMYYIEQAANMLDIKWVQLLHTQLIENNNFNYFD